MQHTAGTRQVSAPQTRLVKSILLCDWWIVQNAFVLQATWKSPFLSKDGIPMGGLRMWGGKSLNP